MTGSTGGKESGWTRVIRKGKQQGWKLSRPPQTPAFEVNNPAGSNTSHGSPGSSYITCKSNFSAGSLTGQLSVNVEGRKGSVSAPGTPLSRQSAVNSVFQSRSKLHLDDREAWPQIKAFYPQQGTDCQTHHLPEHASVNICQSAPRRPQSARHSCDTQAGKGRVLPNTSVWGAPHRLQVAVTKNEQQQQQQQQQQEQRQQHEKETRESNGCYTNDEHHHDTEVFTQPATYIAAAPQMCTDGDVGNVCKAVQPVDQHDLISRPSVDSSSHADPIVHAASSADSQKSLNQELTVVAAVSDSDTGTAIHDPTGTVNINTSLHDTMQHQQCSSSEETMQDSLHEVDSWGSFTEVTEQSHAGIDTLSEQGGISQVAAIQPATACMVTDSSLCVATDSSLAQQATASSCNTYAESKQTAPTQSRNRVGTLPHAPSCPDVVTTDMSEPMQAILGVCEPNTSSVSLTSVATAQLVANVTQQHGFHAPKTSNAVQDPSLLQPPDANVSNNGNNQTQSTQSRIRADAPVFTLKDTPGIKQDASASLVSTRISPDRCAVTSGTSNSTANSSSTSSSITHVSGLQQMHPKKAMPTTNAYVMQASRSTMPSSVPALARKLSAEGTAADSSTKNTSRTSTVSLHQPFNKSPPTFDTVAYLTQKVRQLRGWPLPLVCQVPGASKQDRACCALCRLCPALPPINKQPCSSTFTP